MQCPHHGFTQESLLSTIYRGVLPKIRMLLDTASNGNFLGKDVEDGLELVENLALSDGNYNEEYDRAPRGGELESHKKEMKSLHDKLDKLMSSSQRHVHFVEENQEECNDQVEYQEGQEVVNFVGGQGGYNNNYNNNYKGNNNLSYRSTNVANPEDQVYPPPTTQGKPFVSYNNQQKGYVPRSQYQGGNQGNYSGQRTHQGNAPPGFPNPPQGPPQDNVQLMLQQIIQGQAHNDANLGKKIAEINTRMDSSLNELATQIGGLQQKFKQLEKGKASSSTSQGTLPGKPEANPKEYCHTISTIDEDEYELVVQEFERLFEDPCDAYSFNEDIEVQVGEVAIKNSPKVAAKKVGKEVFDDPKLSTNPRVEENVGDWAKKTEREACDLPSYKPPLPFPERILTKAQKKMLSSFRGSMEKVGAPLPKGESLSQVKDQIRFIKDLLANRGEVEELMESLDPPRTTKDEPKTIPKLGNPGKFLIPCSLGDLKIDEALCDSGSSVNVMSLELSKSLGITDLKTYPSPITFVDASSRQPMGLVEDYPLKIGECLIPTDFIVMEMVQATRLPLLLGTPFLNTVGASFDFANKKVVLKRVNDKIFYPMKPSTFGSCGSITCATMEIDEKPPYREEQLMGFTCVKLKDKDILDHNEYDGSSFDGKCLLALFDGINVGEHIAEPPRNARKRSKRKKEMLQAGTRTMFIKKGGGIPSSLLHHPLA